MRHLSWKRAYAISLLLHIVIAAVFVLCLSHIVEQHEQQTYVVDLTTSDLGSGDAQAGGSGSSGLEDLFPAPLQTEEVHERVAAVQESRIAADAPAIPAPREQPLRKSRDTHSTAVPSAPSPTAQGRGGTGTGAGTGDADGTGSGSTSGSSSGTGNSGTDTGGAGGGSGTTSTPFDTAGFRAAVEARKTYPHQAVMRRLQGRTTLACTIDPSGAIVGVSVSTPSGFGVLDQAAVSAAQAVGSYPNPTGKTVSVTININFELN